MEKQVDITVSVPTYNNFVMLRRALESLTSQITGGNFSFEILVINDGSTDDTAFVVKEVAEKSSVPLRYFRCNGAGVAMARNKSIDLSRGDWIAFFDDDQIAEPKWLHKLFQTALIYEAECVGSNRDLVPESDFEIPQNCVIRSLLGEELYDREFRVRSYRDLPGTGTSLVKKEILESLGGFDESMLSGGSDNDFFHRVLEGGYKIYRTPDCIVHHIISQYRLRHEYLEHISLRIGGSFAYVDQKLQSTSGLYLRLFGRIGQAALINFPKFLLASMKSDEYSALAYKCLIHRAIGYFKQVLGVNKGRLHFREEKQLFKVN